VFNISMIFDIGKTLTQIAKIADCLLFQGFGMNRHMQEQE
jgi:hypothetical protein